MNDLHLIQYDDGCRMSAVVCPEHRPELFDYLDRYGDTHATFPAPDGTVCDYCGGVQ